MVLLRDDGRLLLHGEDTAHASLCALVAFHQSRPLRPHGQLLTQGCGQVSWVHRPPYPGSLPAGHRTQWASPPLSCRDGVVLTRPVGVAWGVWKAGSFMQRMGVV